ncbi:MAG: hypothetical protein ACFFD2_10745 [Promethearchaeota archaeon]
MNKYTIIGTVLGVISAVLLGLLFVYVIPLVSLSQQLLFWLMVGIGSICNDIFHAVHTYDHPYEFGKIWKDLLLAALYTTLPYGIEGVIITFLYGSVLLGGGILWGLICLGIAGIALLINYLRTKVFDMIIFAGTLVLLGAVFGLLVGILTGGGFAVLALILFLSGFVTILTVDLWTRSSKDKKNPTPFNEL